MRRSELRRALAGAHVVVQRDPVLGCPRYVRTVVIDSHGRGVRISFETFADNAIGEGGLYFRAKLEDLEASIRCIEAYLGVPFGDWKVDEVDDAPADAHAGRDIFLTALREGRVVLPDPEVFRLESSDWYRSYLPFPSRY